MARHTMVPSTVSDMSHEEIGRTLDRIAQWKRGGVGKQAIRSRLHSKGHDDEGADLLSDMAAARVQASKKYSRAGSLFFTTEGLRWATPEIAADHCAERMKGPLAADVTCGQGGQVISLSTRCDRVIAVEIDPLNVFVAQLNFSSIGLDNVTLIQGDCLDPDVVSRIDTGAKVFSDPARPPGSPERTLDEIVPDPRRIIEAYSDRAPGFCFEVPPYLSRERIDIPCEAEYVSLDGRLNRLNLYTGDMMRSAVSAVSLPSGRSISGEPDYTDPPAPEGVEGLAYEADHALVSSGLLNKALTGTRAGVIRCDERRTLVLSDEVLDPGFFGDPYRVLSICSEEDLVPELNRVGAGKVTVRYSVDPARYWDVRKDLESRLSGDAKVQLFKADRYIVLDRQV